VNQGFAVPVTNLFAPPWRAEHVSRAHLFATLDAGLDCRLIFVRRTGRRSNPHIADIVAALQTRAPKIGEALRPLLAAAPP
jgi:hypothetical protein